MTRASIAPEAVNKQLHIRIGLSLAHGLDQLPLLIDGCAGWCLSCLDEIKAISSLLF
jgi:hypothetical protein